jgi:mannobiose 2-epimerase
MHERLNQSWAEEARNELVGNILPFWMERVADCSGTDFFGLVNQDRSVDADAPLSCVMITRILWTFAAATRVLGPKYNDMAHRAFVILVERFWDVEHGGLYWMVDRSGRPVSTRKQIYAQAFGVYAFAEYHRATGTPASLGYAKKLYRIMELHGRDIKFGGYFEAFDRTWQPIEDLRLSNKDLNCPKSMNTNLHVMEAYTNLYRVWQDSELAFSHSDLLKVMMDRIVDETTGHLRLFFDEIWTATGDHISFGHDIEASWLLVEAAAVLADPAVKKRACSLATRLATAVLEQSLDTDGGLLFEADGSGTVINETKHWWVQAEAVVGFYGAYQITGNEDFRAASRRVWEFITTKVVNRVHGEWHAKLSRDGKPLSPDVDPEVYLAGPWKCPYHNARACLELLDRLTERKS